MVGNITYSCPNSSTVNQVKILTMVNKVEFLCLKSLAKLIETNSTGCNGGRCVGRTIL